MPNETIPNIPVLATQINDSDLFEKADGTLSGQSQRVPATLFKSYIGTESGAFLTQDGSASKITSLPPATALSAGDVVEIESFLTSTFVSSKMTMQDFITSIFDYCVQVAHSSDQINLISSGGASLQLDGLGGFSLANGGAGAIIEMTTAGDITFSNDLTSFSFSNGGGVNIVGNSGNVFINLSSDSGWNIGSNLGIINSATDGTLTVFDQSGSGLSFDGSGNASFVSNLTAGGGGFTVDNEGEVGMASFTSDGGDFTSDGGGNIMCESMTCNSSLESDAGLLSSDGGGNLMAKSFVTTGGTGNQLVSGDGTLKSGLVLLADGSFSTTATALASFTVAIGSTMPNTTYKVSWTPTSMLAAAVFFISAKSTTTFTVTYLSAITGAVSADWSIAP